jgi:hypothetical protein
MPQASEDPLLTCAAVMDALPAALSWMVMFWHCATGAVLSITFTVALQVAMFPLPSVTVKTTIFVPTLEHVNEFGDTVIDAKLQLSVEPLSI